MKKLQNKFNDQKCREVKVKIGKHLRSAEIIPGDRALTDIMVKSGGRYRVGALFCIIRGGVALSKQNGWDHTLKDGRYHFYARQNNIADLLGMSVITLKRAIRWLVDNSFIVKTYHNTREHGRMNNRLMYEVHESYRDDVYPKYPPANSRVGRFLREKLCKESAKPTEPTQPTEPTNPTGPAEELTWNSNKADALLGELSREEIVTLEKEISFRRDPLGLLLGPDSLASIGSLKAPNMARIKALSQNVNKSVTNIFIDTFLHGHAKTEKKKLTKGLHYIRNSFGEELPSVMIVFKNNFFLKLAGIKWTLTWIRSALNWRRLLQKMRMDSLRSQSITQFIECYGDRLFSRSKDLKARVTEKTLDWIWRLSQCKTKGDVCRFLIQETCCEDSQQGYVYGANSRRLSGFMTWAIGRFRLDREDRREFERRIYRIAMNIRENMDPNSAMADQRVTNPLAYVFHACRRSVIMVRALRLRLVHRAFFYRRPRLVWGETGGSWRDVARVRDVFSRFENLGD